MIKILIPASGIWSN